MSPDRLLLAGHLGETVNVVVTNGYESVQIDKASSTAKVDPGGQITYTLTVANAGPDTATNVALHDDIPPGMRLVGATSTAGSVNVPSSGTGAVQLLLPSLASPEPVTAHGILQAGGRQARSSPADHVRR